MIKLIVRTVLLQIILSLVLYFMLNKVLEPLHHLDFSKMMYLVTCINAIGFYVDMMINSEKYFGKDLR